MTDPDIEIQLDYDGCIVSMLFLGDIDISRVKSTIIETQADLPNAHGWDALYDFSEIRSPITLSDAREVADAWALVGKGRDVGRRTAIVTRRPDIISLVESTQPAAPFRSLACFPDRAAALAWLSSLRDDTSSDVLFI